MCECYKIGGPFIAEDPDCPVHGYEARRREDDRSTEMDEIRQRLTALELLVTQLSKDHVQQKSN